MKGSFGRMIRNNSKDVGALVPKRKSKNTDANQAHPNKQKRAIKNKLARKARRVTRLNSR
jgi:hypothetical protein